jgi:hypothetical protein
MIDAVLSYHADPISCGVTRFSQQLAKRLDVPWGTFEKTDCQYPLISLKPSEIPPDYLYRPPSARWDLFLHEPAMASMTGFAKRVFAASQAIADAVRPCRSDVIAAWCPSLVEAQPREPITVLSFGMAHKIRTDLYETLKAKLDDTGEPYVVYVSAALHEGTSFSDASQSFETLRKLFGMNFVFLGTLSDEAMVDRLRTCTYVAAFFEKGLRENNTTVMAAIEHGAKVLTNHDAHTDGYLVSLTTDILTESLPHVSQRECLHERFGWNKLVELIRGA